MRKRRAEKRDVLPDPIYNSKLVTRAINKIMIDGKRGVAQTILYGAFEKIKERTNADPLETFNKALENITPHLELKVRRIGGANYQVPIEVNEDRKITLGLRWLISYARLRNEKSMTDKLANEILDAANGVGGAVKKKDDTHKMAEANKAFAHYRW
ncbi:30S ribosomal protein S7 [Spiroplasma eriocheiris]|uniref:Small ribosomal subunit protein uS7 n=1 Tax=Spiroplasma eriocheiris TaxID=315358 RepID=A0A0H3XIV3_9MOLU|nr:30S ribosomal protein S7 [Spiroplasma eriocheiris]AHF57220.1 30S ribosomal protein S7 [Spiroplasma eriocheiris CCTCC M 207170]AKM53686.1 30S ribosomal protein S7 [Spiroplasma eriocheiris]